MNCLRSVHSVHFTNSSDPVAYAVDDDDDDDADDDDDGDDDMTVLGAAAQCRRPGGAPADDVPA